MMMSSGCGISAFHWDPWIVLAPGLPGVAKAPERWVESFEAMVSTYWADAVTTNDCGIHGIHQCSCP